ncbi:TetR-like C-terminal domain-containing protein [Streptomyces sp. NPDC057623]|uniref:TetR-like C-terminal domain-containing protein n=1 Tax=Streptomyces sp. NPDC057623 TaxID=3346187 RepID=UPI0036BE9A3C
MQALLRDTLATGAHPLLTLDDGPIRDQLVTHLEEQVTWFNQPVAASVITTVIERTELDEGVRRLREEMFGRADARFGDALAAAVARGEFRPEVVEHARELLAQAVGPLLFQRFMLGVRLDKDMVANS